MTSYALERKLAAAEQVQPRFVDRALLIVVALAAFSLEKVLPVQDDPGGSPLSRLVWTIIYLAALAGVISERKKAARLLRGSVPILLILLTVTLSTIWSQAPEQTAKESLGLIGTSVVALYFVCRLSLKSFLETLSIAIVTSAVLSVLLIVAFPNVGRMSGEFNGAWQGSFVDKNFLGRSMVLGMLTVMCTMDNSRGFRKALQICALILFVVLLAGSHCMTDVFVLGALSLIIPVLLRSRAIGSVRPAVLGTLAISLVTTFLVVAFGPDEILGVFGKDATFTGRTALWQFAVDGISQQPILGYGYSTFFNPETPTGNTAVRALAWQSSIFMAHNGFLEVTLGIGLLGLALVIQMLIVGFKRSAALFWQRRRLATAFPLLVMIYSLLSNVTEAGIVLVNDMSWIVYQVAFLFAVDAYQRGTGFHADDSPNARD